MTSPYPRDLVGYGEHPPQADWPGGARIAVQFVINHEEGGENNVLHGDAASEAFLSEIVGAQPWPGMRHANMESIYEYGARAGFWRLFRMFTARQMPVTVYAVASALQRYPAIVEPMQRAGWEIATHGLKWIDYRDYPPEDERAHIAEAVRIQTELAGERPLGLYQGRSSINTLTLGAAEGGFLYLADSYADELPYWMDGPRGPQLIVPYTLDTNDMRFATPQGFNSGDQFFSYLKDSFDVLYAEGEAAPKMLSVGLHSRLVGRPGRAAALARFLDYVSGHERVWVARRIDIARHWVGRHPPAGGYRPSRMSRALFVAVFGDVFEHTPSLAERVYDAGLGSADDSPEALHGRMLAAMRAMAPDRKLALVRAHPDLAGRLALAGDLTADSTREQGGAGLDRLTPAERDRFTALNTAYVDRFGFPFVVAVRGLDKAAILGAFETRLAHDRDTELDAALEQIGRIALFRVRDRLGALMPGPAPSKLLDPTDDAIVAAAGRLRAGGLVVFPTETVYGLGADARQDAAVAGIYAAKHRPRFNPLIAHVACPDRAMAQGDFSRDALALAESFWPGPLTLVVRASPGCSVSLLARAGLDTVALRVPDHSVARALLTALDGPVVAPSANRSGRISPTAAADVLADLGDRVDLILDGGACAVGLESTIVACLDEPTLLRPGGVPREALEAVLGRPLAEAGPVGARPLAPGQLASHYAPRAVVRLEGRQAETGEAVLDFAGQIGPGPRGPDGYRDLTPTGDLRQAAAGLFAALRALDAAGPARIVVAPVPSIGLGAAINDRLRRAAAPRGATCG